MFKAVKNLFQAGTQHNLGEELKAFAELLNLARKQQHYIKNSELPLEQNPTQDIENVLDNHDTLYRIVEGRILQKLDNVQSAQDKEKILKFLGY